MISEDSVLSQPDNELDATIPSLPSFLDSRLHISQQAAVSLLFTKRLSLIWSPAATGKTESIAFLI